MFEKRNQKLIGTSISVLTKTITISKPDVERVPQPRGDLLKSAQKQGANDQLCNYQKRRLFCLRFDEQEDET